MFFNLFQIPFGMSSNTSSLSLQRTDSTGNLNVFILLELKTNGDLTVVSREDLPPTLRVGKLVLKQKIAIRNEDRATIEGVIVFMRKCLIVALMITFFE